MTWTLTANKLPEEKRVVLIYVPDRPWIFSGKGDIHYVVAWLEDDQFRVFGPGSFWKEEVKAWSYIDEFRE